METLPKIVDGIKRMVQGGITTSDSKFSNAYLQDVVHEARATIIKAAFTKERRIQSVWTQQFYPDYDLALQDDSCCVKFAVPAPMNLDNKNDGFLYIGETSGNCSYRKVNSRAELANFNKHLWTKQKNIILGGNIRSLYSDGILELYNDPNLNKVRLDAIWLNPTLIPTYNIEQDFYPIDDANLASLKTIVLQTVTALEAKVPEDKIQDMTDSQ